MKTYDYLLLGNSAGAVGAVEAIRSHDRKGTIGMISEEPYHTYSRPMIGRYLAGERDLDGIFYRPRDFYDKREVDPLLGKPVESIDLKKKIVKFSDGKPDQVSFEKLLISTGGTPFVPPTPGAGRKGVHTFVTLTDAEGVKAGVKEGAKKVVVVGGGLIGICVSEALHQMGLEVSIVELMDRVLVMNLDPDGSGFMARRLEKAGLKVFTGNTVEEIKGKDGKVTGVRLKDGTELKSDMVVFAIGVRPRIELFKNGDIKINRGIVVDRHMATNVPGVYACGDVAESFDFVFDENRLSPIWPNAYLGGRCAGFNMAGVEKDYPGSTGMTSMTYFDLPIVSCGNMNPKPEEKMETISDLDAGGGTYRKFVYEPSSGHLKGFILVEGIERAGIFTDMIRDRVDIRQFKDKLADPDFSLASLPEDMRRKRLKGVHD